MGEGSSTGIITLFFDEAAPGVVYIDQTLLPGEFRERTAFDIDSLCRAIKRLEIRGAPALGIAGGYGMALGALLSIHDEYIAFRQEMDEIRDILRATRPTAVNLFYGIDRVHSLLMSLHEAPVHIIKAAMLSEAHAIAQEDVLTCHAIGEHGLFLFPVDTHVTVLTHCKAGALACKQWGTALGDIRTAVGAGRSVSVYACETRPLLQGARLTAWELLRDNINVTLITDSMAALLMQQKKVDMVIVGADRITSDAVFNKIGTYTHAITAQFHDIPFYIAAPLSTFDEQAKADDIVLEERSPDEVLCFGGELTAPVGVPVYNPAFDVTPHALISGIITEYGLVTLPKDIGKIISWRS
ncbi:MAG: S-methyl-5-thioribose-1-phosphate isomerase [Methanomicrobiales archaeon]|jgi:methylthioribose-1-phosphate isomerase|nr:S-methyl-5-thioribose-1-phosphate isomerase [Methanomicrobiales archaeon]